MKNFLELSRIIHAFFAVFVLFFMGGCQSSLTSTDFTDAHIFSPSLNSPLSSPINLEGEISRLFLFEGSFPIVLKDSNGKVLATTTAHTKAEDLSKVMVPFSATLTFSAPETHEGSLILEKDNPSGLPQNDDSRIFKVIFAPSNSLTTPPPNDNEWLTYKSMEYQFQYPSNFNLLANNFISLQYPQLYSEGTDLQGATIHFEVENRETFCLLSDYDQRTVTDTEILNGILYYKEAWKEGAAGHIIEHYSYCAPHNNRSFKIVLSLSRVNMDIYSDGQGGYVPGSPKPFDRATIMNLFERIVSTFSFL